MQSAAATSPTALAAREVEAIAAISLMSAMADGVKSDEERSQIKRILQSHSGADLSAVYERVLLRQTNLPAEAGCLLTQSARQMAFEMAVLVADADGTTTQPERAFLASAAEVLSIDKQTAASVISTAEAVASTPIDQDSPASFPLTPPPAAPPAADPRETESQSATVKYAILAAAAELLPDSMATLAIIPLQCRLVYRIGNLHGHALSTAHIKEFIATIGVGMTGQVLEGYARKFLGGILKKAGKSLPIPGGGMLGSLAGSAIGPAMTFATTYALGKVAHAYYAGGRQMSMQTLRQAFSTQVEAAKGLYEQYRPQVEQTARSTNYQSLLSGVMGR
jgi:uncharacterized protein (DUF697 family)/tellurite resistance protein